MMKKIVLVLVLFIVTDNKSVFAQTTAELQATAKTFMRQGDYGNAVLILNRCLAKEPTNTSIGKDLALSYFYVQNNEKALEIIKPVLDSKDADDQCFLITGNIYKQLNKPKESEKIFKKGIKMFPESGSLYNELGEMQIAANNNKDAIKNWEKGIELDPSYSKNYYNAARFYFASNNNVWCILYGEIFVNMEPNNPKVIQLKKVIVESYKRLFTDINVAKNNKSNKVFAKLYIEALEKQGIQYEQGINVESLSMIRSRFIIDWFTGGNKPTFKLFEYQQLLLKEGLFESYNQWLFAAAENETAYQNWIKNHNTENTAFSKFQKSRIFKIPSGQYYQ
jgi:tetratricopeptide (TPR) repeat protein